MRWLYHRAMFGALALTALAVGSIFFFIVWSWTHHRYFSPESGYYQGYLRGAFMEDGPRFDLMNLRLEAETPMRWQWTDSSTVRYSEVTLERYPSNRLTIALPGMSFAKDGKPHVLNRSELRSWIQQDQEDPHPIPDEALNFILTRIEAAGMGTLPGPRHHGYREEEAGVSFTFQHFQLGAGVPMLVFAWWHVWLGLVIFYLRRLLRREKTQP